MKFISWQEKKEKEAMEYSACVKYQEKEKACETLITQETRKEKQTIASSFSQQKQSHQLVHFDQEHETDSGMSVILILTTLQVDFYNKMCAKKKH